MAPCQRFQGCRVIQVVNGHIATVEMPLHTSAVAVVRRSYVCPVRYVEKATCHLPEETGVQQCVLPAIPYGSETWTLTKQAQNKLAAAQCAQRHIQGHNDQHLGQGADKSHRHNQQCETK